MAEELPTSTCPECGAALAPGRVCQDYFHDLLALEAQVTGGPWAEPHFLAVATYNLQHPADFVPAMLIGLRETVADVLAGRATVADARRRARRTTDGPTRVRRHADDSLPETEQRLLDAWPTRWTRTVRDVCDVAPERYAIEVRAWANAVVGALDAMRLPIEDGATERTAR